MWFTSHHPTHAVAPLPKEMYIDAGKYRQGTFHEAMTSYDEAIKMLA